MTNYLMDESTVLWTSDDGNKRIRAVHDAEWSDGPLGDMTMPSLYINPGHSPGVQYVRGGSVHDSGDELVSAYKRFEEVHGGRHERNIPDTREVFLRWLRIFHGCTTYYEYGYNPYVEGLYLTFDTIEWRRHQQYTLIEELTEVQRRVFDALHETLPAAEHGELKRATGLHPTNIHKALVEMEEHCLVAQSEQGWVRGQGNTARYDFQETEHWLEGNNYGIVLEHKIEVSSVRMDLVTRENDAHLDYEWEEQDSVWGFFTDDADDLRERALWQFGLDETQECKCAATVLQSSIHTEGCPLAESKTA